MILLDRRWLANRWQPLPTDGRRSKQQVAFKFLSWAYSHSIVAGGLLVMSYATRFTPGTSATMRPLTRASTS